MKKLLIALILCMAVPVYAGDTIDLSENKVLIPPAVQLEFDGLCIDVGSKAITINFRWLSAAGVIKSDTVTIENKADNPDTDPAECVGVGDPWECCTGEGTGECNEATNDFNLFLSGIGATLKNRSWAAIKQEKVVDGVYNP